MADQPPSPCPRASARPQQNLSAGILLRIAATSCFGIMAAMIKLAHEAGVSTPEIVFYRTSFGLPPLIAWILWSRNFGVWRTRRPFAHAWRALIGLVAMMLTFSALRYLPLAEAITIGFASPLFAVILSALLLKERVGAHRASAVALGFIGVLVLMQPGGETLSAIGLAVALLAALAVAIVTISIRQIGITESTQTTVFWFSTISALAVATLLPFYARPHDGQIWLILLVLGLLGGMGQLLFTASLRLAPVSAVAPFDYGQLLWAVLLGWMLWDTTPPPSTWLGAAIIVASSLYTIYRARRSEIADTLPKPPL